MQTHDTVVETSQIIIILFQNTKICCQKFTLNGLSLTGFKR